MPSSPAADAADLHPNSEQLSQACAALWLATLSLMTAFMHTAAPAHRYMLARRIARNLATLQDQDCFSPASRASFASLSLRWRTKAERLAPQEPPPTRGWRLLQKLLTR